MPNCGTEPPKENNDFGPYKLHATLSSGERGRTPVKIEMVMAPKDHERLTFETKKNDRENRGYSRLLALYSPIGLCFVLHDPALTS